MADDKPCDVHEERLDKLEEDTKEQWTAINKLRDRPPVWVTFVISLLTFLLGGALTFAGLMMRAAK